MKIIKIHNQQEFDSIPNDFEGEIHLVNGLNIVKIKRSFKNSTIRAIENSKVEAFGTSTVKAYDTSKVVAWGNSTVVAWENSSVEAWENSSVEAWGNSSIEARGNSSIVARENSSVEAWGNSTVEARENSSVEAIGNSTVVAWGNSSIEARGNSSVEAWENSSIEARENSSVELYGWSQCRIMSRGVKHSTVNKARVISPFTGINDFIEYFGIDETENTVKLYKAVHYKNGEYISDYSDFKYEIGKLAQETTINTDTELECGAGLHASYLQWALEYGKNWKDLAILEVEIQKEECIVPVFSNGKLRTSKLKVVREVPRSEWGIYDKIIKVAK